MSINTYVFAYFRADFWISEKGSKRKKNRGQGGGSNKGKIWENYRFYFFFFRPKVEFPESVSSRENPRRQSLNLRPEKRCKPVPFFLFSPSLLSSTLILRLWDQRWFWSDTVVSMCGCANKNLVLFLRLLLCIYVVGMKIYDLTWFQFWLWHCRSLPVNQTHECGCLVLSWFDMYVAVRMLGRKEKGLGVCGFKFREMTDLMLCVFFFSPARP